MGIIKLYTDGACQGNPGDGGWAFIIVDGNGKEYCESGYIPNTTNNRMEIQACIEGLEEIFCNVKNNFNIVEIYSDSQYLINTMTQGWQKKKNQDLWLMLDQAIADLKFDNPKLQFKWNWVKGHASNIYNNKCDQMAVNEYKTHKSIEVTNEKKNVEEINITFKKVESWIYRDYKVTTYRYCLDSTGANNYYVIELNDNKIIGFTYTAAQAQQLAGNYIDCELGDPELPF